MSFLVWVVMPYSDSYFEETKCMKVKFYPFSCNLECYKTNRIRKGWIYVLWAHFDLPSITLNVNFEHPTMKDILLKLVTHDQSSWKIPGRDILQNKWKVYLTMYLSLYLSLSLSLSEKLLHWKTYSSNYWNTKAINLYSICLSLFVIKNYTRIEHIYRYKWITIQTN